MTSQGTAISWPLRAWLGVEVGFGVSAVLSIGLSPADTKTNFAWPIQPVVMAAVLGGFYMTSAGLFVLPLFAKRWENVRAMILPAALFCVLQTVATILHWDKFSVGTFPFWLWLASYVLPPPVFMATYWWHRRREGPRPAAPGDPLPRWMHRLCVILGGALTVGGLLVFVVPSLLIPVFPWKLTPLTARSFSAWLVVVGTLLLSMSRENDRTRCRLATPMLILLLPATLLQMLRYSDQVNWTSPALWAGLASFSVIGACGVYLARGSWRTALR